jgi:hypothetical protein
MRRASLTMMTNALGQIGPEVGLKEGFVKTLLMLILLTGCSMARYYQGPAVTQELKKNETNLGLVVASIEADFQQKQTFMDQFHEKGKDPFIMQNLDQKMDELNLQRNLVMQKSESIRQLNGKLMKKVGDKSKIREGDPVFSAIEDFAENKNEVLTELMKEFVTYKKVSEEFEKLAFFTKMVKN